MKPPLSIILRFCFAAFALALLGCEEPRLRTQVESPVEEEKLVGKEEEETSSPPVAVITPADPPEPKVEKKKEPVKPAKVVEVPQPAIASADLAKEVALKRKMLEAQRQGIQTLESDLSRHTIQLNSIKAELQRARIQKSNQGGGIRVERVGGESTVVDRAKQVRELEAKLKLEEQLVAQLTKSLEKARADYVALSQEIAKLEQQ
ncbi:MAG: hypothetical protein AAGF67_15445 [Verrucomicrobiota bacterium]